MVLDPFRWVSFPVLCPTTSRPYFSCKYWMQHFYKILISTSPRSHFFQSTECCGSDCPPDLSVVRMAVIRRSDLDGDRSCACLPEATRWRQATAMIRGWPRAVRISRRRLLQYGNSVSTAVSCCRFIVSRSLSLLTAERAQSERLDRPSLCHRLQFPVSSARHSIVMQCCQILN